MEVRHWLAPDHTRVVADLEGTPAYEILPQPDPLIFTLKLRGIVLSKGSQEISVGDPVIHRIKLDAEGKDERQAVSIPGETGPAGGIPPETF